MTLDPIRVSGEATPTLVEISKHIARSWGLAGVRTTGAQRDAGPNSRIRRKISKSPRCWQPTNILVYALLATAVSLTCYSGLGETMRPILDAMEQWGAQYQAMAREEG